MVSDMLYIIGVTDLWVFFLLEVSLKEIPRVVFCGKSMEYHGIPWKILVNSTTIIARAEKLIKKTLNA